MDKRNESEKKNERLNTRRGEEGKMKNKETKKEEEEEEEIKIKEEV